MKTVHFFLFIFCSGPLLAQWTERIVSDSSITPQKIVVADIDGDGMIDIVSMNQGSDTIDWYKNTGGDFTSFQLVGPLDEGRGIATGDIDGDGDIDVIGSRPNTGNSDANLYIYKNLDGLGIFDSPEAIPTPNTSGGRSVIIVDIDGDGFNDLLVGSREDQTLAWYKNLDGNGSFDAGNIIITDYVNGLGFDVGDIDGDGDLDIVAGTLNYNVMSWFENLDGQGTFGPPIEIGSPGYAILSVFLVDIDGDGDLDIVGSAFEDGGLFWWENMDGQGNFSLEKTIEPSLFTSFIHPVDLDNDGDIDLLALAPGFLRWYENLDGLGNFGNAKTIKDNLEFAITLTAADLDNDGDMDPIAASQTDNTIYWFENDLLGIPSFDLSNIEIYPNPTKSSIKIKSSVHIVSATFHDVLGRKLLQVFDNFELLNVSELSNGLLFLTIETEYGTITKKIIKE